MSVLVDIFRRTPKDPEKKKNREKIKEIRKLVKEKQYDKALRSGLEYLKNVPEHHDVLFIVGGIYYMQKKYPSAILYFDKALEIGSYDIEVLSLKANAHYSMGENKHALQCCEKIMEVDPKNKFVAELRTKIDG